MADITAIKQTLDKAQEVLVLLPQNPGPDSIASALSLHLALQKAGKQSVIACGTPLEFDEYPLRRADQISQKIGNKNLVISLKVDNRESIDKVSYNLDEDNKVFNLIITPKKGAQPLSSQAVSYSLSGARADLLFIVGASSFDDLGSLYAAEPAIFSDVPSVAINRLEPTPFATYHLSNPDSSSIAENMVGLMESFGLNLEPDSATNLLASIDVVTDKLQLANVTATTFETVAKLIRAGGNRVMLGLGQTPEPAQSITVEQNMINEQPSPLEQEAVSTDMPQGEDVPKDWLAPKIYKAPKGSRA